MTAPNIPLKFVKTLTTSGSLTHTQAGRFFTKLLYEFWGFCVNGSQSTTIEGGFAPISGVIAPPGFRSGSTVLWASARDGQTDFFSNVFYSDSVNFAALNRASGSSPGQLIGKYLVTWSPDSDSTDDSVYPIIGLVGDNKIRVEVQVGGTRRVGNKAFFRKRSGIHFRVVDILAASRLSGWSDGDGLVLQFNKASVVNQDQANSQVKLSLRSTQQNVGMIVSPSGSWSGTNFDDGATEITAPANWYLNAPGTFYSFVLIGGRDSLLVNSRPVDDSAGVSTSGLHIEIPKRLYPSNVDPNPVAFNIWSNATPTQLAGNYANLRMIDSNGIVRPMITLARCPWGTHIDTAVTAVSGGIWQGFSQTSSSRRYANFNYNLKQDVFITSDAILANNAGGFFNLSRARLRRVRFTSNNQSRGFRYGDLGWVFVANGVLWPWDNSMQGYGIQPEGL